MHGDHILGAPYVREKWGAKIWTLDRVAEKFEQPERFDYAALIPGLPGRRDRVGQVRPRLQVRREVHVGGLRADRRLDARPDRVRLLHPGHDRRPPRGLHRRQPVRRPGRSGAGRPRSGLRPQQRDPGGGLHLRRRVPAAAAAGPDPGRALVRHGSAPGADRTLPPVVAGDPRRLSGS